VKKINNTPHLCPLPQRERGIRGGKKLTEPLTLVLSRRGRGELEVEKI
jgi:hypothetical protein